MIGMNNLYYNCTYEPNYSISREITQEEMDNLVDF
jgi:hypothetical protein